MKITPTQAKKIVSAWLEENKLPYTKLTARTVSFVDLARDSRVFVKVHGWQASPMWQGLENLAKDQGFCVEAAGFPG